MAALMQTTIPRQVQEAADEAERLEQALQPAEDHAEPPPDPQATPPAAPVASAPPPRPNDDATWQQRYQTLQGMYNAEVPRMAQTIREQQAQINDLAAKIAAKPQEPAKPTAPQKTTQGSEKDVEVFGSDLIDLIRRQSADLVQAERDRINADLSKITAENAQLKEQLGNVAAKQGDSSRLAYEQALEREVPDWQALNVDPGFIAWLAEIDPLSGLARQAYLANAWGQFDAVRTANLFKAYKALGGRAVEPAPDPQKELARQVAPSTSKGPVPEAASGTSERIWPRAQIEKFYTDVTKGHYSNRKDEAVRIEAEIDAAVATGRVR